MQVTGQNIKQPQLVQQQNSSVSNPTVTTQCAQPSPQTTVANPAPTYPIGYMPPQNTIYPAAQNQTYTVPASTTGVNIQIFNPAAVAPGAQPPTYNVNAPCYPSSYYTGQIGPQPANSGGNTTENGNVNTGTNNGTIGNNNNNSNTTINNNNSTSESDKKKTEKRKIVQLTDDYIRNLESYLNSQDKSIRLSAAKEVYSRLEEDDSRADDKALTALINKMLQDPAEDIRVLALSALDGRLCTGDAYTVNVLTNMQNSEGGYGQDASDAAKILLKMSGQQVEKEFEVKEKPKKNDDKKPSVKK